MPATIVCTAAQASTLRHLQENYDVHEMWVDEESASTFPAVGVRVSFETGYSVPAHVGYFGANGKLSGDWLC